MTKSIVSAAALGAAMLSSALVSAPVLAGPAVDACGALAASVYDKGYETTGLELTQIDEPKAIEACEAAVAAEPASADAKYWLARALWEDGRGAEAQPLLEDAAAAGNLDAKALLAGVLYASDDPADQARGMQFAKEAAEAGSLYGKLRYGQAFEEGKGTAVDFDKAIALYTEVYDTGSAEAGNWLGNAYYYKGEATYPQSVEWYEKAIDRGWKTSVFNLGTMYYDGSGVPQDYVRAKELFEQAAAHNIADAMVYLGLLYENGNGVVIDNAKAFEYYQQAAALGDPYGINNSGIMLSSGKGVEADPARAVAYFQEGVDRDFADAYPQLAYQYMWGAGVAEDDAKAIELYEAAIAKGNHSAESTLGWALTNGEGLTADPVRGVALTKSAAEAGDTTAMNNIAWAHMRNLGGVGIDWVVAREWAEKAADLGNYNAVGNLAEMHERGVGGFAADIEKAKELYAEAAAHGDTWSQEQLDRIARGEGPEAVE